MAKRERHWYTVTEIIHRHWAVEATSPERAEALLRRAMDRQGDPEPVGFEKEDETIGFSIYDPETGESSVP